MIKFAIKVALVVMAINWLTNYVANDFTKMVNSHTAAIEAVTK
jgi:hypothetical protein